MYTKCVADEYMIGGLNMERISQLSEKLNSLSIY